MRAIRSRTIASLLAAAGAGFGVSAMIGAPIAVADVCQPGHVLNGQCTFSEVDTSTSEVPAPPDGTGPPGKIMCTQGYSCSYFEGG